MAINLQGLIDEVLKMAQERHAIETDSDRGSNAWNARQVEKDKARFQRSEDEEKKQKLLGDQAMGLQGLKNTGLTDVQNIGETGATMRQRLSDTSKENIAGTTQATELQKFRSEEGMNREKNISAENVARITGEAHVGAAKAAHEIPPPAAPAGKPLSETPSKIAPAPENPGSADRIALGGQDNAGYDPIADIIKADPVQGVKDFFSSQRLKRRKQYEEDAAAKR